MKKLLLLLMLPIVALAQTDRRVDSLSKLLARSKSDTQRVNLLNKLSCVKWDTQFNRCIRNAGDAIDLAKKVNYLRGQAEAYKNRGDVYYGKLRSDSAIADYKSSIVICKKINYQKGIAVAYDNIGIILRNEGHASEAVAYIQQAANIYEKLNDLDGSSNSLTYLANNYNMMDIYDKALPIYKKAYALRVKIGNRLKAAQSLAGIGMTYRNLQINADSNDRSNFKMAIAYMKRSLNEFIILKHDVNTGLVYKEMGITYLHVEDYPNALKNLHAAENIFNRIGFKRELGSLYKGIGKCYMFTNNYRQAKYYLEKGLACALNEHYEQHIMESYQELYWFYKMTGNTKKSLEYHEMYVDKKDSIALKLKFDKVAEMTARYEAEKKQQQINLLNKENTIQKLSIARQKTTTGIIGGIFLVSAIFGGMVYSRKQLKQKSLMQQKMIAQQNLMTRAVLDAEENERKRIAGDLHDGVGQLFSAVKLNLNGLLDRLTIERDEDRFLAENTLALVDESCKEVRIISHRMMPNMLLRSGIASDLKSFIEKIDADRLKVTLEATGFKDRLESNTETMLYRIIQESVSNVIKHAEATRLDISLNRDVEGITAVITDNGKGFDTTKKESFTGIGLKNIFTRMEYLKGMIDYDSAPGKGTTVNIWVPA